MDRLKPPAEPTPDKVDDTAAQYRDAVDALILAQLDAAPAPMRERVAALYRAGRLTDAGLDNAVSRGWITADDAEQIRGA